MATYESICTRRSHLGYVRQHPLITSNNAQITFPVMCGGGNTRGHPPPAETSPHCIVTTPAHWFDDDASRAATRGVASNVSRAVPRLLLDIFGFIFTAYPNGSHPPVLTTQAGSSPRRRGRTQQFTSTGLIPSTQTGFNPRDDGQSQRFASPDVHHLYEM